MFNDRQIESRQLREALSGAKYLFDYLDLAGGIYIVDRSEWAWGYQGQATWNAFIEDKNTPLGFRLRARQDELGPERAKELIEGAAFVMTSMQDFGNQTRFWASDLIKIMKQAGFTIEHKPFGGQPLKRLSGIDMRGKK